MSHKEEKKIVIFKKRDRNGYLSNTSQTQKTNIKSFFSYTEFRDESQNDKQKLLEIYQNMRKKGERQASKEDEYHQGMFMMLHENDTVEFCIINICFKIWWRDFRVL